MDKDRIAALIDEREGRFRVDRSVYWDQEVFDEEIARFFAGSEQSLNARTQIFIAAAGSCEECSSLSGVVDFECLQKNGFFRQSLFGHGAPCQAIAKRPLHSMRRSSAKAANFF